MAVPVNNSVVLEPLPIVAEPLIAAVGSALTVTAEVAAVAEPQLLVAVRLYTPADAVLTVKAAGLSKVEE